MRRRHILQFTALSTLGMFFSPVLNSCSNQVKPSVTTTQPQGGIETKPLNIALIPWIGWGRVQIAEVQGFFKEAGLNVNQILFQTVTEVNTALLSKKADLAWLVAVDLVTLTAQVPDLKFILVADYSGAVDAILGHGIEKPADLKGKKLAREDIPYEVVFVEKYLQFAGLTDQDVEIISMPVPDASAAFVAGKVDAVATYEPFITKSLQERPGSKRLFTAEKSNIIPNGLAGPGEVLQTRREEILAYMRALDKAMKFSQENPQEANEIVAKWVGISAEDVGKQMKQINLLDNAANKAIAFSPGHPLSVAASIDSAAPILVKAGKAPKIVAGKDLIDDSFINAL
jgi:NitT/TauT family transport system substrate-binding protein